MKIYDTLYEALKDLNKRGYTLNFNIKNDHLACQEKDIYWHPEEYEITEVYRFEGMTDPDEQSIVYAIESKDGDRGVLISAYGIYADPLNDDLVKKLHIHR
ncbi:phosphoribosylpyrophosphate synthetase [Solitalea koreensis]|uniref:Phosphoribosylpyrophosphate synthetase n=1 Tax=Solitalea koreensis TaxID=543615 RepID=A0A521BEW8_9SPHI|nr:phosphoribosylpyrophosphate synthetase [Solitalea koreensis]SMO45270.1 hypothetical protein SAMN06265350_102124 [Solitalea koreensis]